MRWRDRRQSENIEDRRGMSFFRELQTRFRAPGDFAAAYVIAHEVGHHVQNLLGTMDRINAAQSRMSREQANQLSVRLELQADFLAGVWAHYTQQKGLLETGDLEEALRAASAVGDDRLQRESQGYVVPDLSPMALPNNAYAGSAEGLKKAISDKATRSAMGYEQLRLKFYASQKIDLES
jgi:predicted metalloprotease